MPQRYLIRENYEESYSSGDIEFFDVYIVLSCVLVVRLLVARKSIDSNIKLK
jgi:hypothetical protein